MGTVFFRAMQRFKSLAFQKASIEIARVCKGDSDSDRWGTGGNRWGTGGNSDSDRWGTPCMYPSMQAILLKPRACITMHGPSRYKITNKPLARKNVPILSTTQQVASRKDGGCNAFLVREVFKHWAAEVEMRKCNALLERTNPEPYQHYDTDDSDFYDGSDYDAEAEGWGITRTVIYVKFPRPAG